MSHLRVKTLNNDERTSKLTLCMDDAWRPAVYFDEHDNGNELDIVIETIDFRFQLQLEVPDRMKTRDAFNEFLKTLQE